MAVYSIGKELAAVRSQETAGTKLQEQVTRLFEEARTDVYRYLLTLGIRPPQAQEATQEVFLRLYATLRKCEAIRNPRAWIFRVAHNHGLKIRARQDSELPFDPELDSSLLVQAGDPEKELADRERLRSMARAARQTAEGFTWSRHVDALLPLYEQVRRIRR